MLQVPFCYQMEACANAATIYVVGQSFDVEDVNWLAQLANAIPRTARMLRVDMTGLADIDLETLSRLRGALAEWRLTRSGDVRLVFRTGVRGKPAPIRRIAAFSSSIYASATAPVAL